LDLRGVVTAIVTPFRQDQSLDLPALRSYVEHVLSVDGVTGILCCGYTGEITSLSREAQLQVVSTCAEVSNGRVPIISGLQPTSTVDTIAFGRQLKAAGADVLQVNSPFYNVLRRGFLKNEDLVVKFFKDLADGIDLPMTVFQYPPSSGVAYPASTIARLDRPRRGDQGGDLDGGVRRRLHRRRRSHRTLRGQQQLHPDRDAAVRVRGHDGGRR